MYNRRNTIQRIHPESEENVRETREEINQQRAQHEQEVPTNTQNNQSQPSQTRNRPIRENNGQLQCPICLGTAEFAVQTNCGHIFCGIKIVYGL